MIKCFDVEEIFLGEAGKGDKIVFKNTNDLRLARAEIDDGKSIYVKTNDGLITELAHRMVYQKIYDGTIRLCARTVSKEGEC